ncbi:RNA polymerase sigma factor [Aquirufa nivalisilvae]
MPETLSQFTDEELLKLLQKGDHKAFEVIYRRYWKSVYGFVYHNLGSKEDSEEILHDLMLSLWNRREELKIENLKIYLFISSRNLINKSIRSQMTIRRYREFQLLNQIHETTSTSDEIIYSEEFDKRLNILLQKMPEKTALIFRMSKIDEIPVKLIASQLALSEKAVEYHLTKSMKFLKKNFKNFYSAN